MKASELLAAARQRSPELPALIAQARRLYDQDTGYIDRALDRLARRLAQDEPGWQTHIVITADHGESFGDDGSFGHGKRLTPAEVHVPLILLSPRAAPGVREDVAASVDIASTLLALAGLPTQGFGHGRDLTQLAPAGGASAFGMRSTFAEPTPDVHVDGSVDELQGTLQFFAVIDGQQAIGNAQAIEGLAPAHGDDVRKLFSIFEAEAQARPVRELLDTQTQAALEALGYTR
jgi:hypothetical protein